MSDDSGVMHSVSTSDDRWLPFAAAEAESLEKAFCDPMQPLLQLYIDFEYFYIFYVIVFFELFLVFLRIMVGTCTVERCALRSASTRYPNCVFPKFSISHDIIPH